MENLLNRFFDLAKIIVERLPILDKLVVEIAVLGLLVYGVYKLFTQHP